MATYKSSTDAAKGSPNLEALQYLQENWGSSEIDAAVRVVRTEITASGTAGVAVTIPVGATILDVVVTATATVGSGSARVRVTDGDNITDAIDMAVTDAIDRAASIDSTFAKVTVTGIEIITNSDSDLGYVDIYYKK